MRKLMRILLSNRCHGTVEFMIYLYKFTIVRKCTKKKYFYLPYKIKIDLSRYHND